MGMQNDSGPNRSVAERLLPLFHHELPMSLMAVDRLIFHTFLETLRPRNALEVGSERGGTSRLIAEYSERLTCFDVDPAVRDRLSDVGNIKVIIGDSANSLPKFLEGCSARGEAVDFAFVDADHSYEGVAGDLAALLSSPVVRDCAILVHDCAMDGCRQAFEQCVKSAAIRVVCHHSDFSQGCSHGSDVRARRAGGLGLIVTGSTSGELCLVDKSPDDLFFPDLARMLGYTERFGALRRLWRFLLPKPLRDAVYRWRHE